MNKVKLSAMLVLLALAGCAPTFTANVDPARNTQMEFARDKVTCTRLAQEAAVLTGYTGPLQQQTKIYRDTFKDCMVANGWIAE